MCALEWEIFYWLSSGGSVVVTFYTYGVSAYAVCHTPDNVILTFLSSLEYQFDDDAGESSSKPVLCNRYF